MRAFILFALLGAAAGAVDGWAQQYPGRAVRFVVPYPPGGATDIISRAIGQKLTEALGQQFVVDNRAGGAQTIGTDIVAKSPPNGYTILLVSVTHSINPSLFAKLPYDSVRSFAPVTQVGTSPNILLVHPSIPVKSVKDLISLARAQPGKLNYASSGKGSGGHLAAELFKAMTATRMTHIPYKGGGPAYVDLMAGQVDLMFTSPVPTLPYVKAGKLRALATTGGKRSAAMPDLPTVAEAGVPGYEANLWYGILAPAGTPQEIVARLNAEIVKALRLPDVRERFSALGVEIVGGTPEGLTAYLQSEIAKWAKVIKGAGIQAE